MLADGLIKALFIGPIKKNQDEWSLVARKERWKIRKTIERLQRPNKARENWKHFESAKNAIKLKGQECWWLDNTIYTIRGV